MKRSVAFTLIELMVVVAIIASLIAILLPSLAQARYTAKFVICGTNQRAVVNAVTVYASGNRDAYPTSIQGIPPGAGFPNGWWTLPNRLNYHSERNTIGGAKDGRDGGWLAKRLFQYLPVVEVFYCPLTPEQPINAQKSYETGEGYIVNGSFYMYWGYHGYNTQAPGYYDGPDRTAQARSDQLLLCDMLAYNEPAGAGEWSSAHPYRSAGFRIDGTLAEWRWYDATATTPVGMLLNAAYVDGHVSSYPSDATVWYHPGTNGSHPSQHFIPERP